ncbi:AlpA family phage regulatory protein [Rothia sp. LK2588]|uniref:helix-turn-helix transcriptional regulator n=1 Tax=Rothia sp. LK2588 TaxID=3114369 RepID=UPI0034CED268
MIRMMTIKDVMEVLAVGRSTFFQMRKDRQFPPPTIYIGASPRWDSETVDAWIRAQRNGAVAA